MQLFHGDCLDILPTLPDASVDAIITDPPYNAINRTGQGLRRLDFFNKGIADSAVIDIPLLAQHFVRISRGSIYVWCSTEQVSEWRKSFIGLGLTTRQCVWVKTNPAPINGEKMWLSGLELCVFARHPKATFNRFCQVPVWRGGSQRVKDFPCPKPVWLMKELITASTNEGETILDCFLGSGTTGVACVNTGREFIGIERDAGYFEIACKRITAAQTAPKQMECV